MKMSRLLLLYSLLVLSVSSIFARHHHSSKKKNTQQKTKETPYVTISSDIIYEPTASTTAALTLKVGNRTINTNLQSALDDISPGIIGGKSVPDSATYPPNVYNSLYKNNENKEKYENNTSSVIFEVLGIDPYSKEHRKFSVRFILLTSLYGTLGLSCILATYCLLRMIGGRQKRNRQYMLLTKRDLDFPLGGGGI